MINTASVARMERSGIRDEPATAPVFRFAAYGLRLRPGFPVARVARGGAKRNLGLRSFLHAAARPMGHGTTQNSQRSPDGAKRNPGRAGHGPRIPLCSIRATATTWFSCSPRRPEGAERNPGWRGHGIPVGRCAADGLRSDARRTDRADRPHHPRLRRVRHGKPRGMALPQPQRRTTRPGAGRTGCRLMSNALQGIAIQPVHTFHPISDVTR